MPPGIIASAIRLERSASSASRSANSGTEVIHGTFGPSWNTRTLTISSDQARTITAGAWSAPLLECGSTVTRTIRQGEAFIGTILSNTCTDTMRG